MSTVVLRPVPAFALMLRVMTPPPVPEAGLIVTQLSGQVAVHGQSGPEVVSVTVCPDCEPEVKLNEVGEQA